MGVGGIYGCGCKEVYRFPIPTPLVSGLFAAASQLFVHLKKCFSFFNNNKKVNRTDCSNLASFKLLQ